MINQSHSAGKAGVQWRPSGRSNPCAVCGRTKDSDCRMSSDGEQVICHHPKDHKPGDVIDGWAFTGNTSDGRAGHFVRDQAQPNWQPQKRRTGITHLAVPIKGPVQLLRIAPSPEQPDPPLRLLIGQPDSEGKTLTRKWSYSETQEVWRYDHKGGRKEFRPMHRKDGQWLAGAGDEPWSLYGRKWAPLAEGQWLLEFEGEKCADLGLAAGICSISQPGHDRSEQAVVRRYEWLLKTGAGGVVYIADNDQAGRNQADRLSRWAAIAKLPFLVLQAKEVWADIPEKGSIDDAPGETGEDVVEAIEAAISRKLASSSPSKPAQEVLRKPSRLRPDEVFAALPERLGGTPRRNLRTRYIEVNGRVLSGNDGKYLYLTLCNEAEAWTKEVTLDALEALADQNAFDPVHDYLEDLACEPLPSEEWQKLDQLLFNIDDPVARSFMPRFLVAAVARVYEPGCLVRQVPVLIGPQDKGKTELVRALFGHDFFTDGLSPKLNMDDVTRLTRVWCLELGELDGITKRTQQEALKAFVSRRVDIGRRAYAAGNEDFPRRSVFMGNSNGAPLRDPTGSTRFVCIPLPDQKLPFEHVSLLRDAIWKRALIAYREGLQWYSTDEEKEEINRRNSDYVQIDPWSNKLTSYLDAQTIYPVSYELLFNRLKIEPHHQNNAASIRVRQICEAHGWVYGQRRIDGVVRRGFWLASG